MPGAKAVYPSRIGEDLTANDLSCGGASPGTKGSADRRMCGGESGSLGCDSRGCDNDAVVEIRIGMGVTVGLSDRLRGI